MDRGEKEEQDVICTWDNTQYCRQPKKMDLWSNNYHRRMDVCHLCLMAYGVRELKLLRVTGIQV